MEMKILKEVKANFSLQKKQIFNTKTEKITV